MSGETRSNLLLPDQVFQTVAGDYRILKKLGGGWSGEVYQARSLDEKRTVAIKVMRPTDNLLIRKMFINEVNILTGMRTSEEEAKDGLFVTPDFYGANADAEIPYIVEELMRGERLVDLLGKQKCLEEKNVVSIGWQLFCTLQLAHTGIKKTYNDLKFENLWWEADREALRITDWGTLEDVDEVGPGRDILRGALYLFRLATGRTITETRGIPDQNAEIYGEIKTLSWGLQEILIRLLNRNPAVRFENSVMPLRTADEVARALKKLSDCWRKPASELLEEARELVEWGEKMDKGAKWESRLKTFRNARQMLDIARQRPDVDAKECERLIAVVSPNADTFDTPHDLYEGTSYPPARHLFFEGAILFHFFDEKSSRLRRWGWLAQAGEDERAARYLKVKADAERAVQLMEDGCYPEAAALWKNKVLSVLPAEALKTLSDECHVFMLIHEAGQSEGAGNYAQAAENYQGAYDLWIKIAGHEKWEEWKVGALDDLARQMRIRQASAGEAEELASQAKAADELEAILSLLKRALSLDPGSEKVYRTIRELAQHYLDKKKLDWATQILWVGGIAPSGPQEADDWEIPETVRQIFKAGHPITGLPPTTSLTSDKEELTHKLIDALANEYFDSAESTRNLELARLVQRIAGGFDKRLEKMEEEMKKEDRQKAENLMAEAESLLLFREADALSSKGTLEFLNLIKGRLVKIKEAEQVLGAARRYADPNDRKLVKRLDFLAGQAQRLAQELEQRQRENSSWHKERLVNLQGEVEASLESINNVDKYYPAILKAALPQEIQQSIQEYRLESYADVLDRCHSMLRLDPDGTWARKQETEIRKRTDDLGESSSLKVEDMLRAKATLPADAKIVEALDEAERAYATGNAEEAFRLLQTAEGRLDEQALARFNDLMPKVMAVLSLRQWERENATLLAGVQLPGKDEENGLVLRRIGESLTHLPPIYWKDSQSHQYIRGVVASLAKQLANTNPTEKPDEFASLLRSLIWTRSLVCQAEELLAGRSPKTLSTWGPGAEARELVRAYFENRLPEQIERLLDHLPVLENPESQCQSLDGDLIRQFSQEERPVIKPQLPGTEEGRPAAITLPASWKSVLRIAEIGGISLILLVLGGLAGHFIPTLFATRPAPTPTIKLTSSTPSTAIPSAPPTVADTPTSVPPTATVTLQPSNYRFQYDEVVPPVPAQGWVNEIPAPNPVSTPGFNPAADSYHYPDTQNTSAVTASTGNATWIMDQQLEGGYYAIYVLDPQLQSNGWQSYAVTNDGGLKTLVDFRVTLNSDSNRAGISLYGRGDVTGDVWRCLGIYQTGSRGIFQISTDWSEIAVNSIYAITPLVLTSLPQSVAGLLPPASAVVPANPWTDPTKQCAYFLDDRFAYAQLDQIGEPRTDEKAWGGQYRVFSNLSSDAVLNWKLDGVDKGTYAFYMWVPESTEPADASLIFNVKDATGTVDATGKVNLGGNAGKWVRVDLGEPGFEITSNPPATLDITITIPKDISGDVPVDAIAIINTRP